MKFRNPRMQGLEVMLCIKSVTHGRTKEPEAICPSSFFDIGGIISIKGLDRLVFLFVCCCCYFFFFFFFFSVFYKGDNFY